MQFRDVINHQRRVLQHEGWRSILFRALTRAGYRRSYFLVCQTSDSEANLSPNERFEIRELNDTDADAFTEFRPEFRRGVFLDRLKRGYLGYGAFTDGKLVCASWIATQHAPVGALRGTMTIPPDQGYVFDSYTHADWRGQRVLPYVFQRLREDAATRGIHELTTFVVPDNKPSLTFCKRQGFEVRGIVRRLDILGRTFLRSSGSAPGLVDDF